MSSTKKLYEGKAKILYTTEDDDILLTVFKDDATAFNAQKKGTIAGKGEVNCTVSAALFTWLESKGILTHYIDRVSVTQMRVREVKIIPIEVVLRNIAAGSLCKQTGLPLGKVLADPLVEFYLKNDDLGDPLLTRDRLMLLEIVSPEQLEAIKAMTLNINQYLQQFFEICNIILVDFKLEFGLNKEGKLILADEISPDTCRLWDKDIKDPRDRVMDKDRFRQDLGEVESAYRSVRERVLAGIKKLNL